VKDDSERPVPRKEKPMFPYNNPEFQLDLAHERAAEFRRQAAAYRLGRTASSAGRHGRSGRRARAAHLT
jgi:hypothetical protein